MTQRFLYERSENAVFKSKWVDISGFSQSGKNRKGERNIQSALIRVSC